MFQSDSETYLNFLGGFGLCKVRKVEGNVFKEEIVANNGEVVFEIESCADYDKFSYIFEDTKIVDVSNNKKFYVRHNQFRILMPLKYEYLGKPLNIDQQQLDTMIFLLGYIWLKKNMTSHDPLN